MARSRPFSAPLGVVATLAMLSLPWQPAASDDLDKGPPPPEFPIVEGSSIYAIPAAKPERPADLATESAPAVVTNAGSEALPEQLVAESVDAETLAADELTELIEALRERMRSSRAESELPLGNLARDLEQARLDVERLAELLLRKEIAELQQRAAQAQTEEQMAWLVASLELAEQRLARLLEERNQMERLAAESTARVSELAQSLIEADDERRRLEESLETTQAGAEEIRRSLAAASWRIHDINQEMASIEAASLARAQAYEQQVTVVETQLRELRGELMAQQEKVDALLAAREAAIQELAARQVQARDVLVRTLAEFDEVTSARDDADEREFVRRAEEASRAREATLADMGFRRDALGNLLLPEIAVAQGDVDFSLIEPAAGPSCLSDAKRVMRPYLDDEVAADWEHYLMGTIQFADAASQPADDDLAPIVGCLEELSDNAAFYFRVIGHTDARGAQSKNQRLSLERAQAVRDIVAAKLPLQPWRLIAQGRGPDYPIASNNTREGQAKNRRVEVFAIVSAW